MAILVLLFWQSQLKKKFPEPIQLFEPKPDYVERKNPAVT